MQENTNKAIAVNSIVTYAKIIIDAILGLFTTRYALIALGVTDYGLFAILGSVIYIIMIVNAIIVSTSNRFLSVAIGKGDVNEINKVFNANLVLFIGSAIILLLIALPIGLWYTNNYINYDGPIDNAIIVFVFSIVGALFSIVANPFNGLLMAKERFFLFSIVEILVHIIRFVVVLLLVYYFENKLFIYTLLQTFTALLPVFIYWLYCKKKFPDIVKWRFTNDKNLYKEMLGFSGWVAYGGIAVFARNQGSAVLINSFFNTTMNAALGLATTVNRYIMMFANSLTTPILPQITKNYAKGNYERVDTLLVMSTKFSFLLMLLVSTPFFVEGKWILHLWLGNVPPFAVTFTILLIIDNLVMSFNSGLSPVIFADGRIALYQLLINTLRLLAVVAAYFALKADFGPQSLLYCYIAFSVVIVFATQYCMRKTLNYDMKRIYKESYKPSITVLLLLIPSFFLPKYFHPILNISLSLIYLFILELFIGLGRKERNKILNFISSRINR